MSLREIHVMTAGETNRRTNMDAWMEKGHVWGNLNSISICLAQTRLWLYRGAVKSHGHSERLVGGHVKVLCQLHKDPEEQEITQY